jgi:hypothetical protein
LVFYEGKESHFTWQKPSAPETRPAGLLGKRYVFFYPALAKTHSVEAGLVQPLCAQPFLIAAE